MTSDQLRAFEQIVRDGTLSRAAQNLEIAQPTISARLQALELELGGPLLRRGGRRVTLTPLGHSFLPYAQRALQVLREGREHARLVQTGRGGRVTVGAIESLTGGFLASSLAHFVRAHPHVELYVRSAHSRGIVQLLQDGVVRLGLLAGPIYSVDLVTLLRFEEPLLLVVSAQHPLAREPRQPLAEIALRGAPLLHVRWGPSAAPFLERLQGVAAPLRDVPIDTAYHMALAGEGVAILTRTLASEELAAGQLVALELTDDTLPTRQSALVRLPQTELDAPTSALVRILRESAQRLNILAS